MGNIKFYLVILLLVAGAGILGYAAINSLRDPVYYVNNQKLATVGDLTSSSEDVLPNANTSDTINTVPTVSGTKANTSGTSPNTTVTNPVTTTTSGTISNPATSATTPTTNSSNADLIARLKKIPAGTVLKQGDKNNNTDYVKAVQEALNIAGGAKLPTTGTGYGNFGPGTESAVKAFQKANNISPQSGQVANQTLAKLIEKLQ